MIFLYLIILIFSIYIWFKYKFTYWEKLNVPFFNPTIPFGNLNGVGMRVHITTRMTEIYETLKYSKQPIFGMYFFHRPVAIIRDLDLIKNIMVKDFDSFFSRNQYHNEIDDPLSAHLVNLDGKKWKDIRVKLTPAFTSGKMKLMFPMICKVAQVFSDTIENTLENELEIHEIIDRFTTDVIGSCAFGIECNSLKNPRAEFHLKALKIFVPKLGMMGKFFIDMYPNFFRFFRLRTENGEAAEFFTRVLKETIEYREKSDSHRNDFLEMMIKAKNSVVESEKLTFDELAAQAYVFFGAGFETSSITLSFCIYELAKNQDIQEKAREEILNILNKYNGELTYEGMMQMQYMQQVIDETLRMYPPVPAVTRRVTKNYIIPGTDIMLKKDLPLFIPIYSIHHDGNFYSNPEIFDPNRFDADEVQKRHPFSYLPFGEGPRNCIGLRLGKMQAYIGGCCGSMTKRTIVGGWAWAWWLVTDVQRLSLEVMTLNPMCEGVETAQGVPLTVTGVAQCKIMKMMNVYYFHHQADELLGTASEQFLGKSVKEVKQTILQTLEGHLRAILGTLTVEEVYKDRDQFAALVREVAAPDVGRMGIEILSFTIKDVYDDVQYLASLGKAQTASVKRDADAGVAEANRDAGIREAECEKSAMDVKYSTDTKIEDNSRMYKLQKAHFDQEINTAKAESQLAYELQAAKIRQRIRNEEIQINVVERRKQIEIELQEVQRKDRELMSIVRLPAEAESYRVQTIAQGKQSQTIEGARAESEKIKKIGLAEAHAIELVGKAEAERMRMKAAVYKQYGDAAIMNIVLEALPKIAAEIAAPLAKTEEIVLISGNDSTTGDVTRLCGQLPPAIHALTGVDLSKVLSKIPGAKA